MDLITEITKIIMGKNCYIPDFIGGKTCDHTHLINGAGCLFSYLATACTQDFGEVLSSSQKVSHRNVAFGEEGRTQWLVHFAQLLSLDL